MDLLNNIDRTRKQLQLEFKNQSTLTHAKTKSLKYNSNNKQIVWAVISLQGPESSSRSLCCCPFGQVFNRKHLPTPISQIITQKSVLFNWVAVGHGVLSLKGKRSLLGTKKAPQLRLSFLDLQYGPNRIFKWVLVGRLERKRWSASPIVHFTIQTGTLNSDSKSYYSHQLNRKENLTSKTMYFDSNYYHFFDTTNYWNYFYQMQQKQMPPMQIPGYLPLSPSPASTDPCLTEELSQNGLLIQEKVSEALTEKMTIKEHQSISEVRAAKVPLRAKKAEYYNFRMPACRDVKLNFRIEWKNENRNIVPNLINQMISYLLKKIKSQKIVARIFEVLPHDPSWTMKKFYLYMKKIKESVTHYVNQNVILKFLEIHQPKCVLYSYDEQLFYMKVSRIAIMKFLEDDAVLISLTSNRMSEAKRKIHLIARDALLHKFVELCKQCRN